METIRANPVGFQDVYEPGALYYAVQGFSPRRGHYVTLFSPYQTAETAEAKAIELREANPQIRYRVVCARN